MSEVPKYYDRGGIVGWDAIRAWGLGYDLGCALKYIMRAGHKTPDPREDLRKAIHCLKHYVDGYEEPGILEKLNATHPAAGKVKCADCDNLVSVISLAAPRCADCTTVQL